MSDRSMVIWFIAGIPIALIDGWLSVQSMFGLLDPNNFLGYMVAVLGGICLTAFAVYVPILRGERTSPFLVVIWLVAFLVDLATSIVGVIWYGVLRQPLNSEVEVSTLHFDPKNWLATTVFVGFVVLVAYCCFKFGQALNNLNHKMLQRRQVECAPHSAVGEQYRW